MKNNKKKHIYYVLLGIGIGLVLGSVIHMISPNVKVREYTDEEIIQKARELGMHNLDEIIEMNNQLSSDNKENPQNENSNQKNTNVENSNMPDTKEESNIKENTLESKQEPNIDNANNGDSKITEEVKKDVNESNSVEYLEFDVNEGDSSEKVINNLFEASIIDNKEEFTKAVIRRNSGRKVHFGNFKIPIGADYDTIIDILTK